MKKRNSLPKDYLALFDEGAADPVGAGEGAGNGIKADVPERGRGETQGAGVTKAMSGDSRRARKTGAAARRRQIADAMAGKSAENDFADARVQREREKSTSADTTVAQETDRADSPPAALESRRAKFRALVDGEFKDLYTEAVQNIIDRRFRHTKTLEERLAAQKPVVEALLAQYGIHNGDLGRLETAMRQGWESPTRVPGPPSAPDRLTMLEQENRLLREEQEHAEAARAADSQVDGWLREAEAVKDIHSGFDLQTEVQNPQFLSLLRARVPMRHAYEVLHLDDIKGGVAQQSAERTEKRVVEGIKAKGTRPVENGISSPNGVTIHSGVSQLSRTDRAELARRAARGERISL